MTLVIITGGIDLSVGAVMTLAMTFGAGAMLAGVPVSLAIMLALFTGSFAAPLMACSSPMRDCPRSS